MPQPPDAIRAAVLAELARTGTTRYGLWRQLGTAIPRSTLYGWLAGTSPLPTTSATLAMDKLGIVVRSKNAPNQ
jgi:hypothetical protein